MPFSRAWRWRVARHECQPHQIVLLGPQPVGEDRRVVPASPRDAYARPRAAALEATDDADIC